jgi:hypothetical protein
VTQRHLLVKKLLLDFLSLTKKILSSLPKLIIEKKYRVKGITKEEGVLNVLMMLPELKNYVGIEEYDRAQVKCCFK